MRRLIINDVEYRLERRAEILGIKLINVRREVQLNSHCWDSSYRYIPLSWRRYKRMIQKKIRKHQLIRI